MDDVAGGGKGRATSFDCDCDSQYCIPCQKCKIDASSYATSPFVCALRRSGFDSFFHQMLLFYHSYDTLSLYQIPELGTANAKKGSSKFPEIAQLSEEFSRLTLDTTLYCTIIPFQYTFHRHSSNIPRWRKDQHHQPRSSWMQMPQLQQSLLQR